MSLPLVIRAPALLDEGPTLMTSLILITSPRPHLQIHWGGPINLGGHNSVHNRKDLRMRAMGLYLPHHQGALSMGVKDLIGRKFAQNLKVSTNFSERIVTSCQLPQMMRQSLSVPRP